MRLRETTRGTEVAPSIRAWEAEARLKRRPREVHGPPEEEETRHTNIIYIYILYHDIYISRCRMPPDIYVLGGGVPGASFGV